MERRLTCIACVDREWGIGNKGELLFHFKDDLKFFKEKTKNHVVIMGRKTYESLPEPKLPDRSKIILSSQNFPVEEGSVIVNSLEELLALIQIFKKEEIFVIGGESVYRQLLPYCKKAYITIVEKTAPQKDTYFPQNLELDCHWFNVNKPKLFNDNGIVFAIEEYQYRKL